MDQITLIISFIIAVIVVWSIISIANSNVRIGRTLEEVLHELRKDNKFRNVPEDDEDEIKRKAKAYDMRFKGK